MIYYSLLIILLLPFNLYAISEDHYQEVFNKKVMPFLSSMEDKEFDSNGIRLHYKAFIKRPGKDSSCLVILPGRSESAEQYTELAYDIKQTNFGKNLNFFILDYRGQGSSERMAMPLDMGHVDQFENYISDFEHFLNLTMDREHCSKKFLFGHSLGAAIGLFYIVDHPYYFSAVSISSPMLKIITRPYPYAFTELFVEAQVRAYHGDEFSLGQKGFDSNAQFSDNDYTTSRARFLMMMNLYEMFPQTKLGDVSNRWIYETMKATAKLRLAYHKIITPINLNIAGIEGTCDPQEMHNFCSQVVSCHENFFKTSRHAIFNDSDVNRNDAIKLMIHFFEKI